MQAESRQTTGGAVRVLVVSSAGRVWALPLACLRETMRPLPLEPIQGAAECVLGLSMIRGNAVPVVDLALLLGGESGPHARYVSLKTGDREVALAVSGVLGILDLAPSSLAELPLLCRSARSEQIETLARKDEQLLLVLNTARLLPDRLWQELGAEKAEQ